MINGDECETPKVATVRDLQVLSVQELEDYIATLEQEIMRADAMIAKKQAHKTGIESLFGKKEDD